MPAHHTAQSFTRFSFKSTIPLQAQPSGHPDPNLPSAAGHSNHWYPSVQRQGEAQDARTGRGPARRSAPAAALRAAGHTGVTGSGTGSGAGGSAAVQRAM